MPTAPSYRCGRIIYAYLRSTATGKKELHPAIILDNNAEIVQPENFDPRKTMKDNAVRSIGVSTRHLAYKLEHVQLPYAASGHSATKLREDCGAIIGWYHHVVIPDDVIGFGGDVPAATMKTINDAVRRDLIKKLGAQLGTVKQLLDKFFGAN